MISIILSLLAATISLTGEFFTLLFPNLVLSRINYLHEKHKLLARVVKESSWTSPMSDKEMEELRQIPKPPPNRLFKLFQFIYQCWGVFLLFTPHFWYGITLFTVTAMSHFLHKAMRKSNVDPFWLPVSIRVDALICMAVLISYIYNTTRMILY